MGRSFQVVDTAVLFDIHEMNAGVRQCCILSRSIFLLQINDYFSAPLTQSPYLFLLQQILYIAIPNGITRFWSYNTISQIIIIKNIMRLSHIHHAFMFAGASLPISISPERIEISLSLSFPIFNCCRIVYLSTPQTTLSSPKSSPGRSHLFGILEKREKFNTSFSYFIIAQFNPYTQILEVHKLKLLTL